MNTLQAENQLDSKRQQAIDMLLNKYEELHAKRLPKREDFNDDDICFIKQKLGPWPRALEAAGIKEVTKPSAKALNRAKRAQRKQSTLIIKGKRKRML